MLPDCCSISGLIPGDGREACDGQAAGPSGLSWTAVQCSPLYTVLHGKPLIVVLMIVAMDLPIWWLMILYCSKQQPKAYLPWSDNPMQPCRPRQPPRCESSMSIPSSSRPTQAVPPLACTQKGNSLYSDTGVAVQHLFLDCFILVFGRNQVCRRVAQCRHTEAGQPCAQV